jgi:hypothetical protein
MLDQSKSNAQKAATVAADAPVVTDWADVFEHADHGLIPLVLQARSIDALKKCLLVIVESLFSRDSDAGFRHSYSAKLDDILPSGEMRVIDGTGGELEVIKKGVVGMLRQIKDFRVQKAAEALAKLPEERKAEAAGRKAEDAQDANMLLEMKAGAETGKEGKKPANDSEPAGAEALFTKLFCAEYGAKFGILSKGVAQKTSPKFRLPLLLSETFHVKFEAILRAHFIDGLLHRCRGTINRADGLEPDEQVKLLERYFTGRVGKSEVWSFWQTIWADVTEEKEIPAKPKPKKKKKGLLGFAKKDTGDRSEEEAKAEWKEAVRNAKRDNERCEQIWAEICAASDDYDPPVRDMDSQLLMELFGRSTNGTVNQMRAINQIVDQGLELGRAFSDYQQGKNIEICLLANCYQRPPHYLGEKDRLREMLKGFRRPSFPLIARYLPEFIRD